MSNICNICQHKICQSVDGTDQYLEHEFIERCPKYNKEAKLYILNTSILTSYGSFTYEPIEEKRVAAEMQRYGYESAVGHQGAVDAINVILDKYDITIEFNRQAIQMEVGNKGIVFKLKERTQEGVTLNRKEVEKIGFEWGLITRKENRRNYE